MGEVDASVLTSLCCSSYPTTWNPTSQVPLAHIPASGPAYPAATLAAEPYQKLPLSGSTSFTTEPQEMPLPTSMPSVQLSLSAQDGQQAPIRTQYATYVQGTSAPPQLSLSSTADSSLSIPRYMDGGPRPAKSLRHASQQSVHSNSSLTNDSGSNEYRYGPPYVGSTTSEISPHTQHPPPPYGSGAQDASSGQSSATASAPPPRDYFPSSQSWTTTAGETAGSSVSYTNGDNRPYTFSDQYKTGGTKPDAAHPPHSAAAGVYSGPSMSHYSWSAT
jgi:hypothetical protein